MAKKVLAVVSEPLSPEVLRSALGEPEASSAEVLVVAPALTSKRRMILSDPDPAIGRAEQVEEETVERLGEEGIEPLLAIQDALQTFPADEIVLFTHAGGEQNWLEEGLVDEAQERFEPPVRHMLVE
ncbi:MAG: hypothetical protein E6G53_09820 [Actinobacteria bacterium]|nr:MAG: hypothetical protein E6G53_09820 [Actinomycetota bacterium]